jgi:hypothetical protein
MTHNLVLSVAILFTSPNLIVYKAAQAQNPLPVPVAGNYYLRLSLSRPYILRGASPFRTKGDRSSTAYGTARTTAPWDE